MANEITALQGQGDNYTLFFLISVPVPKQIMGVNVVPTPANDGATNLLPEIAAAVVIQGERDALNAGEVLWVTRSFRITDEQGNALANPQLVIRARELYAVAKVEELEKYDARYTYAGTRIDEV